MCAASAIIILYRKLLPVPSLFYLALFSFPGGAAGSPPLGPPGFLLAQSHLCLPALPLPRYFGKRQLSRRVANCLSAPCQPAEITRGERSAWSHPARPSPAGLGAVPLGWARTRGRGTSPRGNGRSSGPTGRQAQTDRQTTKPPQASADLRNCHVTLPQTY